VVEACVKTGATLTHMRGGGYCLEKNSFSRTPVTSATEKTQPNLVLRVVLVYSRAQYLVQVRSSRFLFDFSDPEIQNEIFSISQFLFVVFVATLLKWTSSRESS